MGTGQKSNTPINPNAVKALDQLKYETANELGIQIPQGDYWGDLPSRQCGAVGGNMVRKMIAAADMIIKTASDKTFSFFLLSGERTGALGESTGARRIIAKKPAITATVTRISIKAVWACSDRNAASLASAGNTATVTTAQRHGDSECAPPAVCLNKAAATRQATVPRSTPRNAPSTSAPMTLARLITSTSIM